MEDIRYVEQPYQYESFDDYFKIAAPYLWNVKQWNNETIKGWLEAAFIDARKVKECMIKSGDIHEGTGYSESTKEKYEEFLKLRNGE
jgi:hypothetical protein